MQPRLLQPPELRDGDLLLRRMTEADLDAVLQTFVDEPDLGELMGFDEDPGREKLREWLPDRDNGVWLCALDDGEYAGDVAVHRVNWHHERAELGLYTHHARRGRGLGARMVTLATEWLFSEGFGRVQMRTLPSNVALQRMAERAGFEREGLLRSYFVERGRRVDAVIFSRVAP